MTLINANMPKGAALVESSASSNSPSVDGVVAIFDAIMAAVAELDSGDLDMDMKQQAETMAAQLMADTSLQPYLDDTGKADLLPVISHLLGEADSASMEAAPDGLPGDHIHQLNALFSAPLAEAGVANNTADQAQKADAPEAEQSLLALSQSASRQPRQLFELDRAVQLWPSMMAYIQQQEAEKANLATSIEGLSALMPK